MRRLGTSFISLWLAFFGPSLIGWGLWIRASDAGSARFHQTWDWLADKLAYPLIVSPITNWAWSALFGGQAPSAVLAFVVLVALWALVLTLPIMFIAFWWVVLARSMSSTATAGVVTGSSLQAPSGALYIVTMPAALLWAGIRWIFAPDPAAERPVRRFFSPIVHTFLITFVLFSAMCLLVLGLYESQTDLAAFLRWMQLRSWYGYLNEAHIPGLFENQFDAAVPIAMERVTTQPLDERDTYTNRAILQPEFRTMIGLLALRHALAIAAIAVVVRGLAWLSMKAVK